MFGSTASDLPSVDNVAHIIQVALTPVFLLSGIGALLNVFASRLARVADRVDLLTRELEHCEPQDEARLSLRLAFLRRRSHALDVAVVLGTFGGAATCLSALALFVGALRGGTSAAVLFASFGVALCCTIGALAAFLAEMLMASRGLRSRAERQILLAEIDGGRAVPDDGEGPSRHATSASS